MLALGFERSGLSNGIDKLQCVYLAFKQIAQLIANYEASSGMKCAYTFSDSPY